MASLYPVWLQILMFRLMPWAWLTTILVLVVNTHWGLCVRCLKNVENLIRKPLGYMQSYTVDSVKRRIVCVMCGYNEQRNVGDAIASIVGKVDKLIFIDKNGALKSRVLSFENQVDIEYYERSDLNLRESRQYAVSLIENYSWVLVLDADEVLKTTRDTLTRLMAHPVCYRTRMSIPHPDLDGTQMYNDYHPFFMINNGNIYFTEAKDIPRFHGRYIDLSGLHKENRSWNKNLKHVFYRYNYWKPWQHSDKKDRPIEEYILAQHGKLPTKREMQRWYNQKIKTRNWDAQ